MPVDNEFDTVWAPPNTAVDDTGTEYSNVQSAIDNTGTTVLVGPGTFKENISITTNDVTIVGVGSGTVIDGGSGGSDAINIAADNVHISRLAAKTTNGGGGNGRAFSCDDGSSDVSLRFCRVLESDTFGVEFNANNCLIQGCIFESCESTACKCDTLSNRTTVIGCLATPTNISDGFQIDGSQSTVMGCIADDVGIHGFEVHGSNNTMVGNVARSAGSNSFEEGGTDTLWIANQSISPVGSHKNLNAATDPEFVANKPTSINVITSQEQVDLLVDSPNGSVANSAINNGDSAEISVPVADGETLKVYRWGCYQISDGTAPAGLQVQLKDGGDTAQATANTTNNESTDPSTPVASHANSSGSQSIFKLAVDNGTGGDIADPGVGAFFSYLVE